MKIAILTHPLRTNYGGILQNYALQEVLRRMGHEVMTIDRHNEITSSYRFLSFVLRFIKHYILKQKHIPTAYYLTPTRKQFLHKSIHIQQFISRNIKTTEYLKSNSELNKILKYNFDCYVVGSDQVWLKKYVPSTFFDFLNKNSTRRFAYAASGKLDWMSEGYKMEQISQLIKKFNGISVRELSAVEQLRKFLKIEAVHVLDPTLLLCKEDYLSLLEINNVTVKKSILFNYILDNNSQKQKLIESVSKMLKLTPTKVGSNSVDGVTPPIEEWIAGFRDADFVITDSFHGMVFAIIFRKQFLVIGNYKRGIERFSSLLTLLAITDRLIDLDNTSEIKHKLESKIDYEAVELKLKTLKAKSKDFILESLK